MPAEFKKLIEPDPIVVDELNEFQKQAYEKGFLNPAEKMDIHQRIQNRAGQRHEIPLLQPDFVQTISWSIETEEGRRDGVVEKALPFMAVTTYPNGNGSVSLVLTPELQYGELKDRITSFQGKAIYKNSKESMFFEDMNIHATLEAG